MEQGHTFHIPVMGIGFSIDTPVKVAQYGISSVISLVDDLLIEEMRMHYCKVMDQKYVPISSRGDDFRAKRITAYLNLIDVIVKQKFEAVKSSCFEIGSEITKYFEMLPESSPLKAVYTRMMGTTDPKAKKDLQEQLRTEMQPGSIDVNIMTKLDRANFSTDKKELPAEFSDALSALRGYAESTLNSAIILSAGFNRRLYSYFEKFEDFYADATGFIKKKIVLKVSDYRSSIIQGRFFAKKGLWVSEYRVESGLNCGGHAFASDGFLLGPILEEFKSKRSDLVDGLHKVYNEALKSRKRISFDKPHVTEITAQGGIGTADEDRFLLDQYKLNRTGWATPFLLVPETVNVDPETLQKLSDAGEDDLYISGISPLGVPFNNLRNSNSELNKYRNADAGRPGNPCVNGHLISNTEFTEKPLCTASLRYQKLKINQLKEMNLDPEEFKKQYDDVIDKACICHDLCASPRINYKLDKKKGIGTFTAVCPGPNLAYFSKIVTLQEMVDHIYGRVNILNETYRPNMFIKELKMYVEYLQGEVKRNIVEPTEKQIAYFNEFKSNLFDGIKYYADLLSQTADMSKALEELQFFKTQLEKFITEHKDIFGNTPPDIAPKTA